MKRPAIFVLILSTSLLLSAYSSTEETISKKQYTEVVKQNETLEKQISDLNTQLNEITQQTLIPQWKEEIAVVTKAIGEIGEVTLDKEQTINTIQQQYDALQEDAKQYVTNYEMLSSAQNRITQLRDSQSDAEKHNTKILV